MHSLKMRTLKATTTYPSRITSIEDSDCSFMWCYELEAARVRSGGGLETTACGAVGSSSHFHGLEGHAAKIDVE